MGQPAAGCASQPQCEECMLQRARVWTVANGYCGNECVHVCVHESLPCWLLIACCPSNVVLGLRKRSLLQQHHDRSVWVFWGKRNSGVRNCSLPLPGLVNDDLLERSARVGQFYLLCYVVPRVVLHHSVLLSDSRAEDLGWGQDSEVHNQREGMWNLTAQRGGKHGIAVNSLWCTLASLLVQTRVAQNLDEPDCTLKNLVYCDFSLFTHVFALDRDESDCKLQNLLRIGLTPADSRVCLGFE